MNHGLLQNSVWCGPLIIALQEAIVSCGLNAQEWRKLGYQTGTQDFIIGHDRLLRSLSWGDPDYGDCVFQFLRYLTELVPTKTTFFIEHPKVFPLLEQSVPNMLAELGYGISQVPAVLPSVSATDVVRRALSDADSLLAASGAPSTIDRLHTALHGYLRSACKDQGIPLADDASITVAYKALRKEHPKLRVLGEHDGEVGKILASFASVIDALNPLRNHGSVAHPNEQLIGQDEAVLVVNAVRTMFHYLNQKLGI